jgi:hypothetical protein
MGAGASREIYRAILVDTAYGSFLMYFAARRIDVLARSNSYRLS